MSLSTRLKALRIEHKMTQQDVADSINVARTTITGYETKNRQPSHEKLNDLSELFNVSIDYLLDERIDEAEDESSLTTETDLDRQVMTLYNRLSYPSKEEVLKYMNYLKYCEKK